MSDNPNNSVPINLRVRPETREKLLKISSMTYRGLGDTLDWLIAESYDRIDKARQEKMTVEEAIVN